ncbi:M28 family metallopeptidase [Candidatus Latescibacterota bacterium]
MKRRTFCLKAIRAASIFPLISSCSPGNSLPDSNYLVGTPYTREVYLNQMLEQLCGNLEPRPTGSPACERAALIIRDEMAKALPTVELDTFSFDYWSLKGEPEFMVGKTKLEAYPMIETAGTPPEGISGILIKNDKSGNNYGLADSSTGQILGYVNIAFRDKAVPLYTYNEENKRLPSITVGINDGPRLETAVRDKTPVRMNFQVEVIPNSQTSNVVGTIPGESADELLFLAHHDTVYSTPGANDNTASLICMLMLAHGVSGTRPNKTLTFVSTTGEECGYLGANHYAEKIKQAGTFNNLKYVFNLDSISWGPNLWIWTDNERVKTLIVESDEAQEIPGTPEFRDSPGFVDDSGPFKDSGATGIYMNSRGYNIDDSIWHRPEDTPDKVHFESVNICYRVFHEFIQRLLQSV